MQYKFIKWTMNTKNKEQNIPLVNVRGILLGACALGYDSAYCMYRLYLSSRFSAGRKYVITLFRDVRASTFCNLPWLNLQLSNQKPICLLSWYPVMPSNWSDMATLLVMVTWLNLGMVNTQAQLFYMSCFGSTSGSFGLTRFIFAWLHLANYKPYLPAAEAYKKCMTKYK